MKTLTELDTFTRAYIKCALWSSTDNADDSGGEPLDRNYSAKDIAPETLQRMADDCAAFQHEAAIAPHFKEAGHDFWLTRNGHGAGFWDGDWPDSGDELTEISKRFGSFDLYIGDDGQIHGS